MEATARENYDNPALSTGLTIGDIFADFESQTVANRKEVFTKAMQAADFRLCVYNQLTEFGNANAEAAIKAFQEASRFAGKEIERAYNEGYRRVDENINEYEKQGYQAKLQTQESNLLQTKIATTLGSLAGALSVAKNNAQQQLLQITSLVNAQAENMPREIDDKQKIFLHKGLAGTYNKNGIATELSAVGELQMRQDSQKTLLDAQGERSAEYGLYLVQISAHPSSCPLCIPWQAKVLVDDVYKGGKPDGEHELLSTAISAGLFHYNCRHSYIVYIPGYSRDNIFDYDKASNKLTAERYAIEQQQRYNERAIREWKRIEQGSMSEVDKLNAHRRVEEWQARQRALQKYAEDKRIPFYRQYQREAIGGETKPTMSPYNPQATAPVETDVIREPRNTSVGRPSAISSMGANLSKKQTALNEQLTSYNARIEVPKRSVSMKDLSALTAHNEVEYSLFTKGNTRLIIRGDETHVQITPDIAQAMAEDGWKWSGHTHKGTGQIDTQASDGDLLILKAFGQKRSLIYNATGLWKTFKAIE